MRRNDDWRLIAAEMCFMRRTAGYTLSNHKKKKKL
jgi:hypothetical protein